MKLETEDMHFLGHSCGRAVDEVDEKIIDYINTTPTVQNGKRINC